MSKLRAMEIFVGAAREGSFSKAAKAAGLSPASVSRHIAELEAQLGVQLISRTTRSVALTEAGTHYFARAERILEEIADADHEAAALQTTPRGVLGVHSRTLFGLQVLGPLLPLFQQAYPEIRLELTLSERQIRLREEEYDIDLRFSAPQDPSLVQRKILSSQRILVASPLYLARSSTVTEPGDLKDHNCLTYLLGPEPAVWRFMKDDKLQELQIDSALGTDNGELIRRLAVIGDGVALLDDFTVRSELRDGTLLRLLPDYRITNTTFDGGIYAAYRQTSYLPRKIRVFLDFLVEHAGRSRL
ncbi:LysR family transcriptional regulator [Aquamicrobium sp. LC103]|uniref:LysR family transcriptional regulator n=1 Tax=Aquamicrobium sp. LC103 TaxID=1120658 RepID=UPI00063EA03D|nr:LysR family transcriptional regulator [Aquamicrobium sp. LC103]TKT69638.1 LysR family transcriptional regulator [Aquamicrobium sp. LC103]